MKYGILARRRIELNLDGRDEFNLGDEIQTIAVQEIFKEIGINDYIIIDRDSASKYDGEPVVLLYNMYNSLALKYHDYNRAFPLSPKIHPVFYSVQIEDKFIPNNIVSQLLINSPIGCRDEETYNNLLKYDIPSYISGCITALLPKRKKTTEQNKVFLVDIPDELYEYIPMDLKKDATIISHIVKITRTEGKKFTTDEEINNLISQARYLFDSYKNNAKLVITSRLHAAAPCIAMGIPVILVRNCFDFDGRYSWIDKYTPLYNIDKFKDINWNPKPIEYDSFKIQSKEFIKNALTHKFNMALNCQTFSNSFFNRERCIYNAIPKSAILNLNLPEVFDYAIWGVTTQAQIVVKILSEVRPKARLSKVIDLNINGNFEGILINKPNDLIHDELIYFVTPIPAHKVISEQLRKIENSYVLVNFGKREWIYEKYDKSV